MSFLWKILKAPACEERERGRGRGLKQNFYSFYEPNHVLVLAEWLFQGLKKWDYTTAELSSIKWITNANTEKFKLIRSNMLLVPEQSFAQLAVVYILYGTVLTYSVGGCSGCALAKNHKNRLHAG